MKTELGGDRLGSGNKQEISMKNYERSSHDLGYIWRSSMAAGTLVPFMSEVALPGDSFDIDLECDVKTLPTIGPLFGSYKVQLDVFQCPVRLYQGKLHMNMLNIGLEMSDIYLPQMELQANYKQGEGDNQQVNPSSIFSYLNIRGLGRKLFSGVEGIVTRNFNAVPYLGYWDIYKNYYANKQEEKGVVIHNETLANNWETTGATLGINLGPGSISRDVYATLVTLDTSAVTPGQLDVRVKWDYANNGNIPAFGFPDGNDVAFTVDGVLGLALDTYEGFVVLNTDGSTAVEGRDEYIVRFSGYTGVEASGTEFTYAQLFVGNSSPAGVGNPQLEEFPLDNIDDMRMNILQAVGSSSPFRVDAGTYSPYGLGLRRNEDDVCFAVASQEGLGIKTYQSDLFNNWISTEWIDGDNGINAVTAVSVPVQGNEGAFTIDSLNLANKVYNMLNRIAISGGSYDDWLDAVYTHDRAKSCESPVYHGSLIKELAFEEVVSNSDTDVQGQNQPLGTLAGRGRLTSKNKGGKMKIKVDEPSYIIGIASITPRVDYSQGNKWDTSLLTMNDFHKPALDEIGFQDLVTDQMAWFDTYIASDGSPVYSSAGKQPAWINYMTNVNQTKGNFAEQNDSMFMTLNRRYDDDGTNGKIGDLTTYIDPSKFNNIFAQTSLDSQNFWVQIKNDIFARRKMSAKVIPNL